MPTCSVLIRRAVVLLGAAAAVLLATATGVVAAGGSAAGGSSKAPEDVAATVEQLPFCDEDLARQRDLSDGLVFVTTLDGKLSALDMLNGGTERWSIQTGPGPLLSSSIHRLELTNNGKWVRMIPSLGGSLYKFDGESIEPIPFSAEDMLKSSFKFSDDLVISGGKETRSYGVSLQTGRLVYVCTMHGCKNATELAMEASAQGKYGPPMRDDGGPVDGGTIDSVPDDVIVVRRQTQTVRAVESRTGSERWNFSIGHHELERMGSEDCRGGRERQEINPMVLDLELRVIIPEGVICAVSKSAPGKIVWRHKFEVPIVSAWRSSADKRDGSLEVVDLFDRTDWLWNGNVDESNGEKTHNDKPPLVNPSLYIGMHEKQLYIQESDALLQGSGENGQEIALLTDGESKYPAIPWKPLPASPPVAGLLTEGGKDTATIGGSSSSTDDSGESTAIGQSVLYASNYINGNGFFLVANTDGKERCDHDEGEHHSQDNSSNSHFPDAAGVDDLDTMFDVPVKVIIVSMWFWWKEILIISVTTALVLNMILKLRPPKLPVMVVVERKVQMPIPMAVEAIEEFPPPTMRGRMPATRSYSESNSNESQPAVAALAAESYTSRFREDFDLMQCLGKGGFGVVFEVRNKLDDCRYAIKRVVLPNKPESKDRVMREVKTLAHCEHQNIVRYFHAWIETPPPGWQEQHDREWIERNCLSTSIDIETPTDTQPPVGLSRNVPTLSSQSSFRTGSKEKDLPFRQKGTVWMPSFPEANGTSFTNGGGDALRLEQSESCSFIEFRADADQSTCQRSREESSSDTSESESESESDSNNTDGGVGKNWNHADDDSLDIVFKEPSSSSALPVPVPGPPNGMHHVVSIDEGPSQSIRTENPFRKTHRRPLSLDLTSTGHVRKRANDDALSSLDLSSRRDHSQPLPRSNKIYLYIQMQLCHKQSLKEWLSLNGLLVRRDKIVPIFEQIVSGVEYVHLKGLIHRDLKPSNIFFSLDGKIKIGDFGLVTDSSELQYDSENNMPSMSRNRHTRQVGTQLYMSPEQLRGLPYDYKVDIFSLGLILFELLVSFGTEMERICTLKSVRKSIFPDGFDQEYQSEHKLLSSMLSESPKKRPTTFGIKAHPPFKRMLSNKSSNSLGVVDETLVVNGDPVAANGSVELEEGDEWHFELPPRRKDSRTYSSSGSGSGGASANNNPSN
ncbi:eukaryotic translation initiation factor 2-alpha kinase [Anopheles darlingi]|uniref:eukaryotic translation initiation factor 2-alpha kinase n=1 Tax=Anopheles darlingi TaxID=43151 RepID=UPI0021005AA5|nr:eukaryotic translation initiation factor 2-alpha kinase [Anopheles darlingi]